MNFFLNAPSARPLIQHSLVALLLMSVLIGNACLQADNAYTRAAPGIWRGVLVLEKPVFPVAKKDSVSILYEQFKPGELPFNFEVKYIDQDRFYVEIINGSERIRCDSITYGRDKTTARDTVNIYFPEYQSYIHADLRGSVMQGYWVVSTKKDYRIPFVADASRDYRFTTLRLKPTGDLTGQWATLFGVNDSIPEKAIGEFKQEGNRLTGTFRTETGDYRYLEGTVQGRKFWMSCFDGAHAFLFSGTIQGDTLQGEFKSGKSKASLWTAWKDPNFQLGNPETLTTFDPKKGINFDINTPDGRSLRYPGPAFDGKVKVFTIMGTWCPNCRDEQKFLREYVNEHPEMANQMAILGFSFERHAQPAQANAQLALYKKTMQLPFDVVYAGKADKAEAARFFPALNQVIAFPTMIVVDKKGQIRQVHTGFDGPATSKYAAFKTEFNTLIQQLASE